MNIDNLLTSELSRLGHTVRYSHLPVNRNQSVADHSFYVATFAYHIALDLQHGGVDINPERAALKGLLHDAEEGLVGDIVFHTKYARPGLRKAITEYSEECIDKMAQTIHQNEVARGEFVSEWLNAKDNSVEGRVVELADRLDVIHYARQELLSGNRKMVPIMREALKSLDVFQDDLMLRPYVQQILKTRWARSTLKTRL